MSIIDDSLGTFEVIKVGTSYDETSILSRDLNFDTETFSENSTQFRIVQTKHNRVRTTSSIWNYFVFAEKINETQEERDTTSDRILCYLCFTKGIIQLYKKTTSSSNLWKHLCKKHNVKIPKEKIICIKGNNFKFDNGIEQFLDSSSFIEEDVPDIFTENSSLESTAIFDNKFNLKSDEVLMNDPNQKIDYIESFKDIGMQLIHEVHKRPLLYEHQTSNRGSLRAKRENLWTEIYIAMDKVLEIDRLQKMWKNIRDRFKRIRNSEKQGMEQIQKYKYYNQLKFLEEECYNQIKCESNDEVIDEIDLPVKKACLDEFLNDTINTVSSSNYEDLKETVTEENNMIETYSKDDNIKQNSICCGDDNNTVQLSTVSSNPCCNEHLDEFDYFGKFIAFKLRSSPQNKLTELQSKIIHIFD